MKRYWIPIVFLLAIIRLSKSQSDSSYWLASNNPDEKSWFFMEAPAKNANEDEQQIQVAANLQTKQLSVLLPVSLELEKGMRLQILDVSGVVIKDHRVQEHQYFFDIGDLPMGVYSLRIQSPKMLTERTFNIVRSHNL